MPICTQTCTGVVTALHMRVLGPAHLPFDVGGGGGASKAVAGMYQKRGGGGVLGTRNGPTTAVRFTKMFS